MYFTQCPLYLIWNPESTIMYLNINFSDNITKSTFLKVKSKYLARKWKLRNFCIFFFYTTSYPVSKLNIDWIIYHQLEGTVRKGGLVWAEDDCVPHHDVVLAGGPTHARGRVFLQAFEITHKSTSGCCWHDGDGRVEGELELKEFTVTLQMFLILWDETKDTFPKI